MSRAPTLVSPHQRENVRAWDGCLEADGPLSVGERAAVEPGRGAELLRREPAEVATPELTVVVPTLNEASNVPHLLRRVSRALRGIRYEVIIADDASPDGTAEVAESLSNRFPVRVVRRTESPGLSAAIIDGLRSARGRCLAVMDADLQHDPAVLPGLLRQLATADLAIGSRYAFRGKTCGWSILREVESRAAAWLTRLVIGTLVRDPLSGCFAMRRAAFERIAPALRPRGWKLLLDILAAAPNLRVAEVPMTFRARCRGTTKMNWRVVLAWLQSLSELRRRMRSGRSLPNLAEGIP